MRAPLVTGVMALAAGIAVGAQRSVLSEGGPLFLLLALAGAVTAAVVIRPGRRRATGAGVLPRGRPALALLLLAGLLLGTVARLQAVRSCAAVMPAGLPVSVRAEVVERIDDRLRLAARGLELGGLRVECRGEVAARFEGSLPPGEVVAEGRWWRPSGPGSALRPVGLLLVERVRSAAGAPSGAAQHAARTGAGDGPAPGRLVDRARSAARGRVETLFGDRAPLAASLLLAQRDALDREVRDRFARAGLSHLLAISGLHVALVAGSLVLLAGALRLGRGPGAAAAGLGTVGYVAFLGAPHSAARAALQIVLVLAARSSQRPARTEALVAAAALILLAMEPAALFGPGFQLSFAGVAGILTLRRPLLQGLDRLSGLRVRGLDVGRWLADGLATSVAATIATAPFVAWHFGRIAPIGVLANLVAIPLLSAAVPAMALALVVGGFWAAGGRFLAGAGIALLDALDATARAAAGVPWATVAVPGSVAVLLTAAVAIGYLSTRRLGRTRWPVRAMVWAGAAGVVLLVAPLRPVVDRVEVHVIDVGQGDAIALRSPAGRWLLVDAGVATESWDAGARIVVPYLSRQGVRRLEGLVITHPDADHMGGAGAVIRALRPRWVADPGMSAPKSGYLELLRAAAGRGLPWVAARQGMEIDLDGMVVGFLHPAGRVVSDDANDGSVVLRVVYGEFQLLLTGDAPAAVERALARAYGRRLEADVLKVAHHGSSTSTTPELLEATGATLAVISAGRGNRYGHPHRRVLSRLNEAGVAIARTDRHGSVVVAGRRSGDLEVRTETADVPVP